MELQSLNKCLCCMAEQVSYMSAVGLSLNFYGYLTDKHELYAAHGGLVRSQHSVAEDRAQGGG